MATTIAIEQLLLDKREEAVKHYEGDDDLSVATIKISNVQVCSEIGSRDSKTIETNPLLFSMAAFIFCAAEDHGGCMTSLASFFFDQLLPLLFSWKFYAAVFAIALPAFLFLKRNIKRPEFKPTHVFAVSTEEAKNQLRSLLEKVEEDDRSMLLQILTNRLQKAEADNKDISVGTFKSIICVVKFDVRLRDNDYEFLATLNFSRATGKAAIVELQHEYPVQGQQDIANCGSSSDDLSAGSTDSAKQRKINSTAVATAPPISKKTEDVQQDPSAAFFQNNGNSQFKRSKSSPNLRLNSQY